MIVVTGLGAITALGKTVTETWERVIRGERAFREVSLFPAEGYRVRIVGEIPDIATHGSSPDFSRTSELALIAAREALGASALRGVRIGLVVGGSTAGLFDSEDSLSRIRMKDGSLDPELRDAGLSMMSSHPMSAPTDRLARELGPFARVRTLSSACSSGANALLVGATWLELGLVDAALCGAADALCRVTLSGFNALGALDPEGARPFDSSRRGLTLGEGAGFVVLERAQSAAARGKDAVCTLLGWSAQAEAHHITNPEPTGDAPARAMTAALAKAHLTAADIDYVNAHGTGTPLNDPMESRALARVLGAEAARIPVSSQKGQIGHTLAASGAVEATLTATAVARGVIPPTGGLADADPVCAIRHVRQAEKRNIRAALSSSFGFGGMDAVLVFGRADSATAIAARSSGEPGTHAARAVVVTGVSVITPAGTFEGAGVASVLEQRSVGDVLGESVTAELAADRARRLDRASRIAAVACGRALGEGAHDAGVVLGNAYGAVEGTAAYMQRLVEKGARLASPADFPSLVPSSPAGHVSIYLGLKGPTFSVADLGTSGECAITQAYELIAGGEAERVVAVAVEEKSIIIDEVFRPIFAEPYGGAGGGARPLRREGAGAVALASAEAATARGLPVLARVEALHAWWHDDGASQAIAAPRVDDAMRAVVVLGSPTAETIAVLERTPWAKCRRITCDESVGSHEAGGAIAVAVAASLLADPSRGIDAALCIGTARGSGYAITLARPAPSSSAGSS